MSSLDNLWAQREQSSPTSSSRVYTFDEFQKLEEPEEEFLEIMQAYQTITKRGYNALEYLSNSTGVVRRNEPCPSAGNTAAPPPAKEPEKMLTLQEGVLILIPSTHLEQRGVKEAGEHIILLLFIQKEKPNLWVPGPSFQVPDPSFQEDTTTSKAGADELSVNPRGYTHQHAHGKGDSRRGDESSSDIQKTLGVARPSGGREKLGRIIK
ncbi:hypothetical protein DY000_02008193 [Brassica cretica]|uniref:Uncharacterized protein n=1 Tax=Brassica cretica TaxID=69181 RepID=A0ABQ7CHJ5_BRACR|nr:hypothetical protein DY000_02008193 [Brassica cretica]